MQHSMNSARHGKPSGAGAVLNLTQPPELSGFKRCATAVPKSNLILEFSLLTRQQYQVWNRAKLY